MSSRALGDNILSTVKEVDAGNCVKWRIRFFFLIGSESKRGRGAVRRAIGCSALFSRHFKKSAGAKHIDDRKLQKKITAAADTPC